MIEEMDIEAYTIRDVTIKVQGITPYSSSRALSEEDGKQKGETWEDFEARVWQKKAHTERNKAGQQILYIPGTAFKLSLDEAVQNLNEKIPGKGNQTFTKIVKMGIYAAGNMSLGVPLEKVHCEKVYCNAGGVRGVGTRVMRWFPMVHEWGGEITLRIFNDSLTKEKFEEFFTKAGLLAGVGRGRPSTGC